MVNGEPQKIGNEWYVHTDDGMSGPWATRDAAQAASDGDLTKANILHNKATKK